MRNLLRAAALAAGVLLGQQALAQQVPADYVDLDLSSYKLVRTPVPLVLKAPVGTKVVVDDMVVRLDAPGYSLRLTPYLSGYTEASELWDADGGRAGVKSQLMLGSNPETVTDEPDAYRYRSTEDRGEAGAVLVRRPGSKNFCIIYLEDKKDDGTFTKEQYDNMFASAHSAHFKTGTAAAASPAAKPAVRPATKVKTKVK